MLLFFCAFIALRSEDVKTPFERILDYDVHKEEELFAGSVPHSFLFLRFQKKILKTSIQTYRRRSLRARPPTLPGQRLGRYQTPSFGADGRVQKASFLPRIESENRPLHCFDRKPIWTAFITHQILSPTWMSQHGARVVHLNELQRYIFTEEYNPQKTPTGKHELTFIKTMGTSFVSPPPYSRLFQTFTGIPRLILSLFGLAWRADATEFVKVIRELIRKQRGGGARR